ncbi:ApbA-domain-containing protein [Lindgomyces ingoldianus]|uniref:ApbA-domain-containing protein n=1 Tax=Lindgomyces ingoldianus TaxID=673940 RepID=A0ACB6Q852_9PLEO|nr:ApbA-domain-containing protein [Lindgomyces ingoldianus]KAF2462700.1 ApbA-domain-containing protein [Lindgomyces ingoldianus]
MAIRCNILIYGGGAVGSVIGWRLAQRASNHVSVVCRSNYETVKRSGYSIRSTIWGHGRFLPRQVCHVDTFGETLFSKPVDYIVCTNKVLDDWPTISRNLGPLVKPGTTIVSAQNGMNVEAPLIEAFPDNTVLAMLVNTNCTQLRAGFVDQAAGINKSPFLVGITGRSGQGHRADSARRDFLAAMDPCIKSIESVYKERWKKLIFNNAWNSTTAVSGLNTHQLLEIPAAIEVVLELAEEAFNVALVSGIDIEEDFPFQVVDFARKTTPIVPSTLQDARKRRPIELSPVFGK